MQSTWTGGHPKAVRRVERSVGRGGQERRVVYDEAARKELIVARLKQGVL